LRASKDVINIAFPPTGIGEMTDVSNGKMNFFIPSPIVPDNDVMLEDGYAARRSATGDERFIGPVRGISPWDLGEPSGKVYAGK